MSVVHSFDVQQPTMKALKIIRAIFFINLCSFINAEENQIDCKVYPESGQTSNQTCCISSGIYENKTFALAEDDYFQWIDQNQWISEKTDNSTILECIYSKSIFKAAGFLDGDDFNLEKFNSYIDKVVELTQENNITEELQLTKSFAEKCINTAKEIKVKEIQFEKNGIKPEECDFEAVFIAKCINLNYVKVRKIIFIFIFSINV